MEEEPKGKPDASLIKGALRFFIQTIIIIGIALFIQHTAFQMVKVDGPSMQPTLEEGDRSLIKKWDHTPERNDIIVFDAIGVDPNVTSQSFYIKRVIGLPGDKVAIKGGHLYVNDELILQPYLVDDDKPLIDSNYERTHGSSTPKGDKDWDLSTLSKDNTGWPEKYRNTTVVPEDSYFVMGDHRSVSVDSRFFGYVPRDHVVGVVID